MKMSKTKYVKVQIFGFSLNRSKFHSLRLNSGNAFYNSVEILVVFFVLSKNIKIQVFRTVMLSFVLCGYGTWSVTLREEHWLRLIHIHQHMHIAELKVILKLYLPICSGNKSPSSMDLSAKECTIH